MNVKRFAVAGAAVAAVALLAGTACGPTPRSMNAPTCTDPRPEGLMLVAQSVPSASYVPCVVSYPAGWEVGAVEVRRGRTSFQLHARPEGLRALTITLQDRCDLAGATPVPTDEPGVDRFDRLPTDGGSRMVRTYTFEGGCVTYAFTFADLKPSVVEEAAMAVGFLSRVEVDARYDR